MSSQIPTSTMCDANHICDTAQFDAQVGVNKAVAALLDYGTGMMPTNTMDLPMMPYA